MTAPGKRDGLKLTLMCLTAKCRDSLVEGMLRAVWLKHPDQVLLVMVMSFVVRSVSNNLFASVNVALIWSKVSVPEEFTCPLLKNKVNVTFPRRRTIKL
jgi:hypothetical protein